MKSLSSDWIRGYDKQFRRPYYFNKWSGESQWEEPEEESEMEDKEESEIEDEDSNWNRYAPPEEQDKRVKRSRSEPGPSETPGTPSTPGTPGTPDAYMTAEENWAHEARRNLRNQFPNNLPKEIVNNAIAYANSQGSMYLGTNRENTQEAIDAFYEMVLVGIQNQMKIVSDIFAQIMLMRERNRLQPSSSTLASSVIGLPSGSLNLVGQSFDNLFKKK